MINAKCDSDIVHFSCDFVTKIYHTNHKDPNILRYSISSPFILITMIAESFQAFILKNQHK